ncbi:MAG: hypothetical protein HQL73_03395 [Magnetococcales bacterium]|nr:hypothetical protein [Magnetococcales bacterium]
MSNLRRSFIFPLMVMIFMESSLGMGAPLSDGQGEQGTEALSRRVEKLEGSWDRERDYLIRERSLQQESLKRDIDKRMDQFEDRVKEKERDYSVHSIFLVIIIEGSIFFVGLAYPLTYMILERKMDDRISKEMDANVTILKELVKTHKTERDWIEQGHISLLSLQDSTKEELEKLVRSWGFKKIDSRVVSSFEPLETRQVVLFNKDICEKQDLLWEYIRESPGDTVFVAYTEKHLTRDKTTTELWRKLVTANMPATLFGQMMTAFWYHDALKRASGSQTS